MRVIKGYNTQTGYVGYISDRWILFPTEDEYLEACRDPEDFFSGSILQNAGIEIEMIKRNGKLYGSRF